jgi:hypothetical protein
VTLIQKGILGLRQKRDLITILISKSKTCKKSNVVPTNKNIIKKQDDNN